MKNTFKCVGIAALIAVIAFSMAACPDGSENGGGNPNLGGTITISPNTGVAIGTELTAAYSGTETVSYQWKKDGANVGENNNKHTPGQAGSYTVTVSATGYSSKTSAAVTVTGPSAVFTSLAELTAYLTVQPANTAATPYAVALNINALPDIDDSDFFNRYVYLDLSGSIFTSIGDYAFEDCTRLTGISIPNSVISIGDCAFSFCESLANITIPDSVTSIGDGAFLYSESLTSITIPNSVTSIGVQAFLSCTNLTSVAMGNSVSSIGAEAFYYCSSLASITIPNSVTIIGNSAFSGCYSLANITIPNSVTSIGDLAFANCISLASVTFEGTIPSGDFNINAFFDLGDLRDVFYATNAINGTPGTYTTANPGDDYPNWTRQ